MVLQGKRNRRFTDSDVNAAAKQEAEEQNAQRACDVTFFS